MELNKTVEMMNSEDFRERFKAEYCQLKIRTLGLTKMLEAYKDGTLNFKPKCSYELLYEQLIYMRHYLDCLRKRAIVERIDLSDIDI
jgi:hypothetical protein